MRSLLGDGRIKSVRENMLDPMWYLPRMGIIDEHGHVTTLKNLKPGQAEIIRTLRDNRRTCILKPRQIGATTMVTAFLYHRALFCESQYNVYELTHEQGACGRINQMLRNFWRTTPQAWKPTLAKDNSKLIKFGHNGSTFQQSMAGGRSQGRSFTFQAIHATEMGLWPRGSSAREGTSIDEDVWSSSLATIHENDASRIIIESTAEGPSGIFWKMVQIARAQDSWAFLFFPWSAYPQYEIDPPPTWERNDEEQKLYDTWGLTDRQLAWRRMKIIDQGYGPDRFRKEYPLTWEEPFLLSGGMWFNTTNLNRMLAGVPSSRLNDKRTQIKYEDYVPWKKYFIGGDPAGGVGGDQSVWQVFSEDLVQVAVFSSNKVAPNQFADIGAKLSANYGKAPLLVESNNYGKAVIAKLSHLGARIWKDKKGKDWWSDPRSKAMLYDYARACLDNGHVELNDPSTLQELLHIREQKNGNIEADEGNYDDRADATALALWNARRVFTPKRTSEEQRTRRYKAKRLRTLGL